MSELRDALLALSNASRDARELAAGLHRQSVALARAASRAATVVSETRDTGGARGAAVALQAASRATELASLQLERAATSGDEFAARHAGGSAGHSGEPGTRSDAPAPSGSDRYLADRGLAEFNVSDADYSDNPIVGSFARSQDMSRDDYVWAAQTWDEVVRPGLERGLTRDDFAAMDTARGAPPLRRAADVFDMFLGSMPIRLERRADGTLHVIGGRHRIDVALELGIRRLPAVILGPRE